MDANNQINTGIQQRNDEFQWFKPTPNVMVEGHMTLAPDYSIPPTPASSYSNLHVVLDTVHPSVETITHAVLPPHSHYDSFAQQPQFMRSAPLTSSFTPAPPTSDFSGLQSGWDNRLDDVPLTTSRAVPDFINPEQPGGRAADSLFSLKSEVAPVQPPFVPLEEFDDLAERTDRALPDAVDLPLVDETRQYNNQWSQVSQDIKNHNWNLHQVPERDARWARVWDQVGDSIKNKDWKLRRGLPLNFGFKFNYLLDQLENAERQWRMSRPVDHTWSDNMEALGNELMGAYSFGWPQWFASLKNRAANKASGLLDSAIAAKDSVKELASDAANAAVDEAAFLGDKAVDMKNNLVRVASEEATYLADKAADLADAASDEAAYLGNKAADMANAAVDEAAYLTNAAVDEAAYLGSKASDLLGSAKDAAKDAYVKYTTAPIPKYNGVWAQSSEPYMWSFPRRAPADIIALEEAERADRIARGINPIVSGMWNRLGQELLHTYKDDLKAMFSGLRFQLKNAGAQLLSAAKDTVANLSTFKAPAYLAVPKGADYLYTRVNFSWPRDWAQTNLWEEAERAERIVRGINPIVSGWWFRLGEELKYKLSIRPTLASTADAIKSAATDAAIKAGEVLGSLVEQGKEMLKPAEPAADFIAKDTPLNLFAYSAEPIDFTFKSRRCPKAIIAMEEAERAARMKEGVDSVLYNKWNNILSAPHKTIGGGYFSGLPSLANSLEMAKEVAAESSKGLFGMFNRMAHSVADTAASYYDAATHSKLAESAKDAYTGMADASSIAAVDLAEEAERQRRMASKGVDPLTAARLARVQNELHNTIKSV